MSPDRIFDPLYYTAEEIEEKKNRQAEDEAEYFKSFDKPRGSSDKKE